MLRRDVRVRWLCAVWLVISSVVLLSGCSGNDDGPLAQTRNGPVQGFTREGVSLFYGIPYAAPPVGGLRWQPPRPLVPGWQEPRRATRPGPLCFQYMLYMQRGEEDCLYLNVATPSTTPDKPKPVMVWFHGGGFIGGDGLQGSPLHRLAKRGDVVVVSMNYRVGAFGFLAHPGLSTESRVETGVSASGNYGLMDQQAALRWVQDNIHAFGGDPGNVTLFGESAGGMSVCAHLVSPLSAGLFRQAIIQSGPCMSHNPALAAAEKQGELLVQKAGCADAQDAVACLRGIEPEAILNALPNDPAFVFGEGEYGFWGVPVVDGRVLTATIPGSFRSGRFNRVPVINGNTGDEGTILVMFSHEYRFKPLQPDDYEKRIRYLVGDNADAIAKLKARYPLEHFPDPGAALAELFGDGYMVCNVQQASQAMAPWTPVYGYTFTYPDAAFILPERRALKAFHGAELQFVFHGPMGWFEQQFTGDELALTHAMMDYWSQFAHSGNPNKPGLPAWPLFAGSRQQLLFDRQLSVSAAFKRETCAFWQELGVGERRGLARFE